MCPHCFWELEVQIIEPKLESNQLGQLQNNFVGKQITYFHLKIFKVPDLTSPTLRWGSKEGDKNTITADVSPSDVPP